MSETHHDAATANETGWGGVDSTYVHTTIRIRNTYIHTYLSEPNARVFGSFDFGQNNAYCNTLSRGWW